MHEEYPKSLYKNGWVDLDDMVIVHDPGEEAAARIEGYLMLSEPEPSAPPKKRAIK